MKKLFPLLLLLAYGQYLFAQACANSAAQIDLHANNARARILNNGRLFTDLNDGLFIPNPTPAGANPSTIFAAALWMGAVDPASNLRVVVPTYSPNGLWPGPLDPATGLATATSCANWDRHFRVLGADVAAFLANLPALAANPQAALSQYPGIMGWPGQGNPYFATVNGFDLPFQPQNMAPFFDADNNAVYNPLAGDYPVVELQGIPPFVPAELIFSVFNTVGANNVTGIPPLRVEVRQLAWAFNCPAPAVLNNTVFVQHRFVSRELETMDSCHVGMWVDFDLGCSDDDYVGSAPGLESFFAYNTDVFDGGPSCANQPVFGEQPPVMSVTFMNRPLDKFMTWGNPSVGPTLPGMADPTAPWEFYNYLTGSWRDGAPLVEGGNGYPSGPVTAFADHAFPDNPASVSGWSMCTAGLSLADRRALGVHKLVALQPGGIDELVTAWTFHPQPDFQPCALGDMYANITALRTAYANNFAGVCSPLTAAPEVLPESALRVWPNPASDLLYAQIDAGLALPELQLFAADGRLVRAWQHPAENPAELPLHGLPAGFYTLRLTTEKGALTRKVAVVR